MASKEAIQSAVTAYIGAIDAMNPEGIAATFAPDGVTYDPPGAPPQRGQEAIRGLFQGLFAGAATLDFAADRVYVVGDEAAVKWTGHLTGKRGGTVTFEGIDVMTVGDDSKIRTLHAYWDPTPVLAVLQGG